MAVQYRLKNTYPNGHVSYGKWVDESMEVMLSWQRGMLSPDDGWIGPVWRGPVDCTIEAREVPDR